VTRDAEVVDEMARGKRLKKHDYLGYNCSENREIRAQVMLSMAIEMKRGKRRKHVNKGKEGRGKSRHVSVNE
jgi:hypothetical protein